MMSPYFLQGLGHMGTSQLLGNASSNASDCPEGNQVIWETFQQCITSPQDWASFGVGLAAIAFWLGVLMPQIVENCKDMHCVASISAGLLFSWIFGDTTNLVGAFLTKQGLFQVLLGVWFVMTDLILTSQLIYYHVVVKRRDQKANSGDERRRLFLCVTGTLCMTSVFSGLHHSWAPEPVLRAGSGRRLLSTDLQESRPLFQTTQEIIGYALGIMSSVAYFISRSFQIYKNFKYQQVKGLSTVTFVMAVLGNLLYGLAIVLYSVEQNYSLMHLPWLLGSWGIMFMDCFIVYQIKKYSKEEEQTLIVGEPEEEVAPLLNPINSYPDDHTYGAVHSDKVLV